MKKIASDPDAGISGDDKDLYRRTVKYGKNVKPRPQDVKFLDSIVEALDEKVLLALAIAGFLCLITGMIYLGPALGWIQGASIFVGIIFIVSVTSANDWVKDR